MKKELIVPVIAAAMLCACANSENVKPQTLEPEFTASVSFTQRDQDFAADMTRTKDGGWSFKFTKPETIEGLTLSQADKVVSISLGELNYIADPSELPDTSPVKQIAAVSDKLVSNKDIKTDPAKKNVSTVKGSLDNTDFRAKLRNGKLLSMEIGEELSVKFSY